VGLPDLISKPGARHAVMNMAQHAVEQIRAANSSGVLSRSGIESIGLFALVRSDESALEPSSQ
jgi:hypothetical protein